MLLLINSSARDGALAEVMPGLLCNSNIVIDLLDFNDCTNVTTPSSLIESFVINSSFNVVLFDNNCNGMLLFATSVEDILIIVIVLIINSWDNRS